jgi:hypothetical protein
MTWSSRNTSRMTGSPHLGVRSSLPPIPSALNIEVVYDTSPETTTRAARGGLLMEGLRLSMLKQDGHGDLHGLGHRSVTPYVHGEDCCITVRGAVQALS